MAEDVGFELDGIRVTPSENRIVGPDGRALVVEPKVMEVLCCLAHAGRTVPRDELLREVWPDVVVTDHVLSRSISELRRALGDDHRAPRFIETVRKRGYRLIPTPTWRDSSGPDSEAADPDSTETSRRPRLGRRSVGAALAIAGAAAWIVATAERDGSRGGSASTVDPLRTELPLTSYPGSEVDPDLSPDGSRVAFSWDGGGTANHDIYLQETGTRAIGAATPARLTRHPGEDKNPAWSPDGSSIAFVRSWVVSSGIHLVDVASGEERPLHVTRSGDIPDLAWSSDGRHLYFVDRTEEHAPFALVRLDVESGRVVPVTAPPARYRGDRDLAVSATDRIAFARAELDGVEDLYVVDAGGGEARRLTRDRASITGIEWSAGGDEILFSSNRVGATRLWRIDAAGDAQPRPVLGFGLHASDPSRAEGRLAYERREYRIDLRRVTRGPDGVWSQSEVIAPSTRVDAVPSHSPDGARVAFVSTRGGDVAVWTCGPDGSAPRRLASADDVFPDGLAWSPDADRIAFNRR